MGTTRYLRTRKPSLVAVSVEPDSPLHGLEGLKHLETALVPAIYDPSLADENIWIETEDAHRMVRRAAREEGVLIGISSGANLMAARTLGKRLVERGESAMIVTILCDGADKYLSEDFWNDPD